MSETDGDGEFRVEVVREHEGLRVRPIGEVDLATIGLLRACMDEVMAAAPDRVTLDLRATTFLDSNGLHLVLGTDTWATVSGSEFLIIAGPPLVQHAFDAAGLTARLPFVDGTQSLSYAT